MSAKKRQPETSRLTRALDLIERAGNLLPHPATLFAVFAIVVVLASGLFARLELVVTHPSTGDAIRPISLLNLSGLHRMLTEMVSNFVSFAPLGTVSVAMLGIGLAESCGLIGAALKKLVRASKVRKALCPSCRHRCEHRFCQGIVLVAYIATYLKYSPYSSFGSPRL